VCCGRAGPSASTSPSRTAPARPWHSASRPAAAAGAYWTGLARPTDWDRYEFADGTPAKQVRCPGPAPQRVAATAGCTRRGAGTGAVQRRSLPRLLAKLRERVKQQD
jgi:hypothetical protein